MTRMTERRLVEIKEKAQEIVKYGASMYEADVYAREAAHHDVPELLSEIERLSAELDAAKRVALPEGFQWTILSDERTLCVWHDNPKQRVVDAGITKMVGPSTAAATSIPGPEMGTPFDEPIPGMGDD